jgi:hypothetical protein
MAIGSEMTSLSSRIVFLHVPKTGGTWAVHAMQAAGIELVTIGPHVDLHEVGNNNGRIRVAFVREPLSWYGSWWRHRHTFNDWRDDEPLDQIGRAPFDTFLTDAMRMFPSFLSDFFERFTGPPDSAIEFVGRYERLADDLVDALALAGESFDERIIRALKPINVSSPEAYASCSQEIALRLKETEVRAYQRFYPGLL